MILLSCLVLSIANPSIPASPTAFPTEKLAISPATIHSDTNERIEPALHSLIDSGLYFGAGALFGSATILSGIGWGVFYLTPWSSTIANECLISSQVFGVAALHAFGQVFKSSPFLCGFFKQVPSSYSSWDLNNKLLSEVPAATNKDKELIEFLQRRWLAKITGTYPFLVNWMCPSFGISYQVHRETTNSYTRDPANKFSDTYRNRLEAWKQFLPHPQSYPLVLTRPSSVQEYLPSSIEIPQGEAVQISVEKIAQKDDPSNSLLIVDLTSVLPGQPIDRTQWLESWHSYEKEFCASCIERQVDLKRIMCVQRVKQDDVAGIRILPFSTMPPDHAQNQYQTLMEWIGKFGLSANRIELDRLHLPSDPTLAVQNSPALVAADIPTPLQKQWVSFLDSVDHRWKSKHPQKTQMLKGTLKVLKELCLAIPQSKWEEIARSPTQASIVHLCFTKIKEQLGQLLEEADASSFHATATHLEQVHYDLSSLLEIFAPFSKEDFLNAYRNHLTSIPKDLQPLTGYAIHASAMTSLGGIFKAVQKMTGRPIQILFGENTYFECIRAVELVTKATQIPDATEEDWKEVDLIMAQFNPTVKRINSKVTEYQATEYHVEKIADFLHKALNGRGGRPLSLALDCTLDFSNSPRIEQLLSEFKNEIERGDLNIMCYRSGLKFDLFGMDNYCGAPFTMTRSKDEKWACFDTLLNDPALQTDSLSMNWFCLAYKAATPYIEWYRKQIFDNTREVLNRIPKRLYSKTNEYFRVIPIDQDADPTFLDIKIFGRFHAFRAELLVGVHTTLKCMEAGFPLLFRPGIGFHHPNLAVLYGTECSTVRLTIGLDPAQIDVVVRCLELVDACNGHSDNMLGVKNLNPFPLPL
ncbi:MAG: hypothetical protein JSR39_05050 [Verrucomicrobia bacterium]|nr:hypothetical protein [Verrucomicrobiota bacterium]